MTAIVRLDVADDVEAWRNLGFVVSEAGRCRIGTVELAFTPVSPGGRGAVVGWTLAGVPDEGLTDVDGLATTIGDPPRLARAAGPAMAEPSTRSGQCASTTWSS